MSTGTTPPWPPAAGGGRTGSDRTLTDPTRYERPEAGRVLSGRYRLVRPIARGGMAEVFQGVDQVLGRQVAVKVLPPHRADDAVFLERFRREAIAAARLSSPAIVATYDTGVDEGAAYIVMELVEGRTLRQILSGSGPLDEGLAVTVAAQVAGALAAAHRAGIVHRDIKPGNILVADDDGGPRVKVTDFGIAKARAGLGHDLTQTGIVLGTPKYLAPEQVSGAARVDASADLYSLGVVSFEMLTGRAPFDTGNDMATAMAHVNQRPPRVSSLRPGVDPALDDLVDRLLRKRPEERPPSASAVRSALDSVAGRASRSNGQWSGSGPRSGSAPATARQTSGAAVLGSPQRERGPQREARWGGEARWDRGPTPSASGSAPGGRGVPPPAGQPPDRGRAGTPAWERGAAPGQSVRGRQGSEQRGRRGSSPPATSQRVVRRRSRRRGPGVGAVVAGVCLAAAAVVGLLLTSGSGGAAPGSGGSSAPGGSTAPAGAVTVTGVAVYLDSTGAGHPLDNPGTAPNVLTGASGGWSTVTYASRGFGGLYDGEGLALHLAASTPLASLTVTTPTPGWSAEVFVASAPVAQYAPLSSWGVPASKVSYVHGTTTFPLAGRRGSWLLLWITRLAPGNRAAVGRVSVRS